MAIMLVVGEDALHKVAEVLRKFFYYVMKLVESLSLVE